MGNILSSGVAWADFGYSSNLLWTPAQLTTATWLDASRASSITLTSGNISTWTDLSASAYTFNQATGNAQPRWSSANTLNGLNVAVFDRGDILSATTGPQPGANNQMMLIVAQLYTAHDGRFYIISNNNGSSRNTILPHYAGDSPKYLHHPSGTPVDYGFSTAINSPHIFSGYRNGNTVGIGVNGSTETTNSNGQDLGTMTFWTVGALANNSGNLNGFIAEIVVVSSYDTANYQKLQGYLAWKWGLQGNLPSGHTYKNKPPFN